jgi:type I restriction enzyme, S subunit
MAWEGAFGIVSADCDGCHVSPEFPVFEIVTERLVPSFLGLYFQIPRVWKSIAEGSTGTNVRRRRLHPEDFLRHEIPLPPLSEQRRVVARIEELAAQIHEARSLRAQLVMQAEVLIASSVLPLCSSLKWPVATVSDLVGTGTLQNGKSVKSSEGGHGIRCLTLSAVRRGLIDIRDSKPVPLTAKEAEPFSVRKGDVFVVRGNGSKALCGQAGLIVDDCDHLIFPDLFIRVPLQSERVLPEFFVTVWNSPSTRGDIEEKAKTTSGIWKINQEQIASTKIPTPPLKDQRLIMAELDLLRAEVDRLKIAQCEVTRELDAFLPGVLDRAFIGEL